MGRLDEDLREVLRVKAVSDAIYAEGNDDAVKARRAAEAACFGFIHEHGYTIMGLFHLNQMAKSDVTREDFMSRTLGPDWKTKAGQKADASATGDGGSSAHGHSTP